MLGMEPAHLTAVLSCPMQTLTSSKNFALCLVCLLHALCSRQGLVLLFHVCWGGNGVLEAVLAEVQAPSCP